MILKQVIRYENAEALEATWITRQQLPDVEVPESFGPTTRAEDGSVIPGEVIPAHTVPGGILEIVVKCQAYSNAQMDLLAADLGADAPQYQDLMDEVAATYVAPPPEVPQVPASVSMRQARLALDQVGLLDDVEAAIAAIPNAAQRRKAQIEWEYAQEVQRRHGLVPAMAQALGMTDAQLDDLFLLAATL